ncbi:MAG TPA: 3-oxoacyl-[acyl-carrier-protein] synthase III C-terminal domain-containing protein [Pseudogracilibacillus sp.]|nr:3-oxoacyl-[acyl-carrier-protein] synthase III C-terminal domain-containing protein [Pseudogracilibacillus sp.]
MVWIASVGIGQPTYEMTQKDVCALVERLFTLERKTGEKIRTIFENAKIEKRQFVVPKDWFLRDVSFEKKNERYKIAAIECSLRAIDDCLQNDLFLDGGIPYDGIDLIVYVSNTGITTPSLDAFILNERPFSPYVNRMPLWGLGCAGGAIGLSRAADWLRSHPTKTALVVCCELCSLTFQRGDRSLKNIVSTALFGDGAAATLLVGTDSPYKQKIVASNVQILRSSSFTKKNSTHIMGWNISEKGFDVIFSKRIPKLIRTVWKKHLDHFMEEINMSPHSIQTVLAHPGGRKVLEEMEQHLLDDENVLQHSYNILKQHGNMSSATIMYVLHNWLLSANKNEHTCMCALGPGFSSEFMLLECM